MASKSKKRSKGRAAVNPIDQVRRSLARGDFRQALKDARVCYRQQPTPEHRCYLEHAYIGRAQQLARHGLIDDSRRIVQEMLDLGVTEPAVEAGLPELLLSVGMLDRLPQGHDALNGEERDRLRLKAADQAVLRPENVPKSMAELREGAGRIRAALEAVEQRDESAALAHLKDIARQSPFADWRYFVRGLTAYYRHDKTGMLANWERLDPDRAAAKIAAPLKAVAGVAPPKLDVGLRTKISRLEKRATDQTVLSQLVRLRQSVGDGDWRQAFKTLRGVRGELRKLDAGIYRRLVSCLCGVLVHDGLVDELGRLAQIVDPMPIDPYWNRAKACACHNSEFRSPHEAERYWRKYLLDLENLPALLPWQRDLARALVWLHIAEFHASGASTLRDCRCGFDHGPQIENAEGRAQDAFEQCLALAPGHAKGYVAMAEFHLEADRPEEAARVYQRLLDHVPDHLDALLFLGRHYVAQGEPLKAREYAQRAREQKPLDQETGDLLWSTHVDAACSLARSGQIDEARGEMAAADRLKPGGKGDFNVLARKAALEIKAGSAEAARRFIEQALERLEEPAPMWLAMTVEAIRYALPREEAWLYEKRWTDALKRRRRSQTAGLMCRTLVDFLRLPQRHFQRQQYVQHLLRYVRRATRVKWQADDLRNVLEFLEEAKEPGLLAKLAKQGARKFPEVAYFHFVLAMMEMAKGPFRYDDAATAAGLRKAIELASQSNDPRDKRVLDMAKRSLTLVENVQEGLYDDDDDDDDDYDDDDEDDDCSDGYDAYYGDDGPGEYGGGPFGDETVGPSPDDFFDIIRRACRRAGLDPEEVLEKLSGVSSRKSRGTRRKK